MNLYKLDPLNDPRWHPFLTRHARASVFHTHSWIEALRKTYDYESVLYTTSPPNADLTDGVVFSQVNSWLTGRRMVSLPFSDHCDPLLDSKSNIREFWNSLRQTVRNERWRYIEIRPRDDAQGNYDDFIPSRRYILHTLDLRPDLRSIFGNFHKDSIQRKIRRAEREGLACKDSHPRNLVDDFYELFLQTRKRHHIPPQPLRWFQNLVQCFGDSLTIRTAFRRDQPIASILTLQFKDTMLYKYGCSAAQYNNLGGTQLLFWRAIQDAKTSGLHQFDLGRSDVSNAGLMTFKDRWGATRSDLNYLRWLPGGHTSKDTRSNDVDWKLELAKRVFTRLPDSVSRLIGNIFYPHIG